MSIELPAPGFDYTGSRELAPRAEIKRRRELEEGYHGLKKRLAPQVFKAASDLPGDIVEPQP